MTFEEIKSEVLAAAKTARACDDQYQRAAKCDTMDALSVVMRENFLWLAENKVLTGETVDRWNISGIVHNRDVSGGECCIATGSGTVTAAGSSTVTAYGSSTVTAYGSSTVRAYDSSTVTAAGSSTVTAYDSNTVRAYDSSTVTAAGSSTVRAYDSSTVRAYGSSYINAYSTIECKVSERAIMRVGSRIVGAEASMSLDPVTTISQ